MQKICVPFDPLAKVPRQLAMFRLEPIGLSRVPRPLRKQRFLFHLRVFRCRPGAGPFGLRAARCLGIEGLCLRLPGSLQRRLFAENPVAAIPKQGNSAVGLGSAGVLCVEGLCLVLHVRLQRRFPIDEFVIVA